MTCNERESEIRQQAPEAINSAVTTEVKTEEPKVEERIDELTALQKLLEEQKALVVEYLDQWRRTAADFANYRKRQEQEQQQRVAWANADLMINLLPVLDDLERALNELPNGGAEAAWAEGVRLVERKMRTTLERAGLEEIGAGKGQLFDPNLHEAVLYEESSNEAEGNIIETVRKGYRLGDRVLRPAMVKVARSPTQDKQGAGP